NSVAYNCDGTGNLTLTAPATPVLSYTYSLHGGTTTQATNVFNNLAVGTHTVAVNAPRPCPRNVVVTVAAGQAFGRSVTGST
ncbi:hypothetical protein, partial [Tenacibaculum halocynthiae]|uniref:hypothetical protein n=1 Tax=Tenacibaculum halocynthiae TaxID=1254437 RepID=UPI003D65E32A